MFCIHKYMYILIILDYSFLKFYSLSMDCDLIIKTRYQIPYTYGNVLCVCYISRT